MGVDMTAAAHLSLVRDEALDLAQIRAELAEAEVERLRHGWKLLHDDWREERALADALAAGTPEARTAWEARRQAGG
jgi:hypothetical protein